MLWPYYQWFIVFMWFLTDDDYIVGTSDAIWCVREFRWSWHTCQSAVRSLKVVKLITYVQRSTNKIVLSSTSLTSHHRLNSFYYNIISSFSCYWPYHIISYICSFGCHVMRVSGDEWTFSCSLSTLHGQRDGVVSFKRLVASLHWVLPSSPGLTSLSKILWPLWYASNFYLDRDDGIDCCPSYLCPRPWRKENFQCIFQSGWC